MHCVGMISLIVLCIVWFDFLDNIMHYFYDFCITLALFASFILNEWVYSNEYLRMNPGQMYYHDDWEDSDKFPHITSSMKMSKDNMQGSN